MKEKKRKYISILNVELKDLVEDIDVLMAGHKDRSEKGEISNYVFQENQALFKGEISCLNDFANLVLQIDLDRFQTLEELRTFVEKEFKQHLNKGCYAPAIEDVVTRKLRKVLLYVES